MRRSIVTILSTSIFLFATTSIASVSLKPRIFDHLLTSEAHKAATLNCLQYGPNDRPTVKQISNELLSINLRGVESAFYNFYEGDDTTMARFSFAIPVDTKKLKMEIEGCIPGIDQIEYRRLSDGSLIPYSGNVSLVYRNEELFKNNAGPGKLKHIVKLSDELVALGGQITAKIKPIIMPRPQGAGDNVEIEFYLEKDGVETKLKNYSYRRRHCKNPFNFTGTAILVEKNSCTTFAGTIVNQLFLE